MQFLEHFEPELVVASPGRINLIGEHTDYNMGFVLPTAIGKKIIFKFKRNGSDTICNVYTLGYEEGFQIDLQQLAKSEIEWHNYILGVLYELMKRTDTLRGFDCTIESNLPTGSGLSSSAALECGLAYGLNELFGLGLSKLEIVQLCQTAEHTFAGTLCGIMDQYASVMSKAGKVILLDCRSLDRQMIPISLHPYKIIMLNTKVSHSLATSEYNVRKAECEEGVRIIQEKYPEVQSLRDVTVEMLQEFSSQMNETVYKRCAFILEENARVFKVTRALQNNQLKKVGAILYEAHHGISQQYEVSCSESDFLVEFSKNYEQVLGARQTGGGFGGCTLNIVHEDAVDDFVKNAAVAYKSAFEVDLEWFEVAPSEGTTARWMK